MTGQRSQSLNSRRPAGLGSGGRRGGAAAAAEDDCLDPPRSTDPIRGDGLPAAGPRPSGAPVPPAAAASVPTSYSDTRISPVSITGRTATSRDGDTNPTGMAGMASVPRYPPPAPITSMTSGMKAARPPRHPQAARRIGRETDDGRQHLLVSGGVDHFSSRHPALPHEAPVRARAERERRHRHRPRDRDRRGRRPPHAGEDRSPRVAVDPEPVPVHEPERVAAARPHRVRREHLRGGHGRARQFHERQFPPHDVDRLRLRAACAPPASGPSTCPPWPTPPPPSRTSPPPRPRRPRTRVPSSSRAAAPRPRTLRPGTSG